MPLLQLPEDEGKNYRAAGTILHELRILGARKKILRPAGIEAGMLL